MDGSYQPSYRFELKWLPDNATGAPVEQISQEGPVDRVGDDQHRHQGMAVAEQAKGALPGSPLEYYIGEKNCALRHRQQKIRLIEAFRVVHSEAG
jgi:hypothetical protein